MAILVIRPEDTEDKTKDLEFILQQFSIQFESKEKNQQYYHVVIKGEYPREVLDQVEKLYREAGWPKVICKTSSEGGERAGLTGLQVWKTLHSVKPPISEKAFIGYTKGQRVSCSNCNATVTITNDFSSNKGVLCDQCAH